MSARGADTSHRCPAPGCAKRCPRDQYACRRHWLALPATLRATIVRTQSNRDRRGYLDAIAIAGDRLRRGA